MVELAEIFRVHGPAYRAKFGAQMLPSHRRAMQDIEQCRTEALGGQLYQCDSCQEAHYRLRGQSSPSTLVVQTPSLSPHPA